MIRPIQETLVAKGHTPQYRMHKYFARRPYNVFSNLINHYSNEGEIVLDCFCGGGVTVFEGLNLHRKVIGIDINPLATFITEMQIQQVNIDDLKNYFDDFMNELATLTEVYEYNINGQTIEMDWMEWVYDVICPECGQITQLNEENKISNGRYLCSNSDCFSNKSEKKGVQRTKCKPYSSTPLRFKYQNDNGKQIYLLSEYDQIDEVHRQNKLKISEKYENINYKIPSNWDRWYEDCLPEKGVNTFSDLFTKRNIYINTEIFNKILKLPETEFRDILYFAFSSSLRYTNNMTRVSNNWENGNPTSMDKHAYWLPNVYVETNVIKKLQDRMNSIINGLKYTNETFEGEKLKANNFQDLINDKDYLILTQSSSDIDIPSESIDVVITDPPYGSNVQYGELSSFWNIWYMKYKKLDHFIFNDEEAVANRKSNFEGAKDVEFYGEMLKSIFTEMNRVLKPDGYLVFTFNNKNINVWIQMLKAVVESGFYLPEGGVIYQDFIKSYKNTSHLRFSGNIHGDFIYSFSKGKDPKETNINSDNIEDQLEDLVVQTIKQMYSEESHYTTTVLYERIYSSLVRLVIGFLQNNLDNSAANIENFSDAYIDNILNRYLFHEDDHWRMKEGV